MHWIGAAFVRKDILEEARRKQRCITTAAGLGCMSMEMLPLVLADFSVGEDLASPFATSIKANPKQM